MTVTYSTTGHLWRGEGGGRRKATKRVILGACGHNADESSPVLLCVNVVQRLLPVVKPGERLTCAIEATASV